VHGAMRHHSRVVQRVIGEIRPGDVAAARQLADFWGRMRAEIVNHHRIEDTVFFPGLLAVAPEFAAMDEHLGRDHDSLDVALEDLALRLDDLVRSGASSVARRAAVEAATVVADLLHDHLEREEGAVFPIFLTTMTASTYAELDEEAALLVDKKELPFIAPWLLAHATAEQTERLYAAAPSVVKLLHKVFWRRAYVRAFPLLDA